MPRQPTIPTPAQPPPIAPPLRAFPIVDEQSHPTRLFLAFLQQLWDSSQGAGGMAAKIAAAQFGLGTLSDEVTNVTTAVTNLTTTTTTITADLTALEAAVAALSARLDSLVSTLEDMFGQLAASQDRIADALSAVIAEQRVTQLLIAAGLDVTDDPDRLRDDVRARDDLIAPPTT